MKSSTSASRRRASRRSRETPVDVTTLVSTVLDEEAQRRTEQAERDLEETKLVDGHLPGVGADAVPMREILRRGGAVTIGVLFALNFVDEFDRIAFAILGPDIQRSLDISDAVLAIAGSLGGLLVFAAAIPIGYLADRMRRTLILGVFSAFWAVFSVLTGLVRNSWQLLGARALTGIGKANEAPVQKPMLADAYPLEGRSRIYAIHNAANPVGNLLGPALAGGIAAVVGGTAGWRWAFVILSLPAAALAVAAFFLPEPRRGRGEQEAILGGELADEDGEVPISLGPAFARLRKIKSYSYLLTAVAAIGFGFVTAPIFINLMLEEQFGLDAAGRGLVGTIVATGAVVGAVLGGRYGDELFRRSPERLMALVGVAVASFGVTMPVSVYMPNVWGYLAVAWASALFTTGAFVPASAIIAAVTPFRLLDGVRSHRRLPLARGWRRWRSDRGRDLGRARTTGSGCDHDTVRGPLRRRVDHLRVTLRPARHRSDRSGSSRRSR